MRQLTLELEDKDMARLDVMASARRTDPATMAKAQLLQMLIPDSADISQQDEAAKEARRKERLEALSPSSGIWAGEPNKPRDGVAYQEEMRAEWP